MDEVDLEDDEDIIEDMELMDQLHSGSSSGFSSSQGNLISENIVHVNNNSASD